MGFQPVPTWRRCTGWMPMLRIASIWHANCLPLDICRWGEHGRANTPSDVGFGGAMLGKTWRSDHIWGYLAPI